ncbi:MAG: ArsR/SmtB family transcription factor [Flavobacteriales bacterium]
MSSKLNTLFRAIADPTRREIFHALVLAAAALSISEISNQFEMSRQGVTKHIKILNDAGLVSMTTKGRTCFCLAKPDGLKELNAWIQFYEKFWDNALDNLERFLDKD